MTQLINQRKWKSFISNLKKKLRSENIGKCRVHTMDETGLYSDSIPPNMWTFNQDKEACVRSTRYTLVAFIRLDGKEFATFITHRDQRTQKCKKKKKKEKS